MDRWSAVLCRRVVTAVSTYNVALGTDAAVSDVRVLYVCSSVCCNHGVQSVSAANAASATVMYLCCALVQNVASR